jgi:hypothetical protein
VFKIGLPFYFSSNFFVHCKVSNSKYLTFGKDFPPNQDTSISKTINGLGYDPHNLIFHVIYGFAIKQTFKYDYLPPIISTSVPETLDFRRRGGSCKLSNATF